MSDAFSDLWNSTGVSKPVEPPRKLGSLASNTPVPSAARKPQHDVFSALAAAGSSSNVGSRSITPAQSPALGSNAAAKPMQKAASTGTALGGNDAFSGLLSGFSSTQSSNGSNLTMAQRAALAEKERRERAQQQSASPPSATSHAWAGLDALGSSSTTANSHTSTPNHNSLDDLGFGAFSASSVTTSPPIKVTQSAPSPDDDWGFGEFSSQPAVAPAPSRKAPAASQFDDLLGFDDLNAPSAPRQSSSPAPSKSNTLGDFDFGNREDGLLGNQSDDEDDILGDLSKPVEQLAARRSARNTPSPQPPQSGQRSRAVSPPPHVLGQIVEMGFSIQQARVALAATDTGLDVQAALETLLSNGAGSSSPAPDADPRRRPQREPGHERYYESDEEAAPPARQPQRTAARPPPPTKQPSRDRPSRDGAPLSESQQKLQEQADKLLAQASEVGLNLFNRANAFWKEGKERVQKAYEERAAAAAAAGPSRQSPGDAARRNGKPKWMQDAEDEGHAPEVLHDSGFKDDDDDVAPPPRRPQAKQQQPPTRVQEQPPAESPASRLKVGNLFSDDPPAVYVSPFRRKGPSRSPAVEPAAASAPATPAQRPSPSPARAPSPIQLVQRSIVSASPAAIAQSAKQKAAGTEKFKLGQYAEAEALYSSAITALPPSHLLLVPLYNNRALARIKTGDHSGAIEDCTTVINLIGPAYHPSREAKVVREEDGAGVDLADGLVKAWWRRAEAYEGKEKWDAARKDWESIAGADFAGKVRSEAVRGIGRCRRMLKTDVETGAPTAPAPSRPAAAKPRPKPTPKPAARVPTPPSDALNRVREAHEAAEAEDQTRHELKDAVEARLGAWKAGKEANLRALIASLDTVLWPELGWQKVGIHELVSPSQVKIRYTKAIAKVHPDKLNVRNTTVEQRMIANGVFGALNEAWNAFKP